MNPRTDENIVVSCLGIDNNFSHFMLKLDTPMIRLKQRYCNQNGIDSRNCIFIYNYKKVQNFDTPRSLNMQNVAIPVIDVSIVLNPVKEKRFTFRSVGFLTRSFV